MNLKIVLLIILLILLMVFGIWYWYVNMAAPQQELGAQPDNDAISDISSDLSQVPSDSGMDDDMKSLDQSVKGF
jgi:cytoskeletal protein RodZ